MRMDKAGDDAIAATWGKITGRTLHDERLKTMMECPALFDHDPVKNYNRMNVCVICDAQSATRDDLTHTKPNCEKEFRQIMMLAWYLSTNREVA